MSKILLPQNKETVVAMSLFGGALLLLFINGVILLQSLLAVYGIKEVVDAPSSIDGTTLSEAIRLITPE